jgi:excisionase family DNA binding protein
MNNSVKIEVPVPITMVSNQDLIDELNRREAKVKWARIVMSPNSKPKDRVKLGLSPSTIIDEYMDRTFSKASQPHINTVRRWIREGKLSAIKMGRSYYIEDQAGEEYANDSDKNKMDAVMAKILSA